MRSRRSDLILVLITGFALGVAWVVCSVMYGVLDAVAERTTQLERVQRWHAWRLSSIEFHLGLPPTNPPDTFFPLEDADAR